MLLEARKLSHAFSLQNVSGNFKDCHVMKTMLMINELEAMSENLMLCNKINKIDAMRFLSVTNCFLLI